MKPSDLTADEVVAAMRPGERARAYEIAERIDPDNVAPVALAQRVNRLAAEDPRVEVLRDHAGQYLLLR